MFKRFRWLYRYALLEEHAAIHCVFIIMENEDSFGWTSLVAAEISVMESSILFLGRKKRRMTRMKREASLTSEMIRRDSQAIVHTIHLSIFITRTYSIVSFRVFLRVQSYIVRDRRTNIEWLIMNPTTSPARGSMNKYEKWRGEFRRKREEYVCRL